jgi:hypothetical protein
MERKGMRAIILLLLGLMSCSCASYVGTCPDSRKIGRLCGREVTVISDIDDTIKNTHVKLGRSHIPNPTIVLDPFQPWHAVPGMADVYRHWQKVNRATFVYLSASPCAYAPRLKSSIPKWCFPVGTIVLREVGPLIPPSDYKTKAIYPIIENSPGHHFVLVGDSGEKDPECYGDLAREFPNQIDHVYIRQISGDKQCRYQWAFRDIWQKCDFFICPDKITNLKTRRGKIDISQRRSTPISTASKAN